MMRFIVLPSQISKNYADSIRHKLLSRDSLISTVSDLRALGKSIATLNGSFDLLHAGHLEMIYQASLQADVLIVGLNTDSSIQRYKSPLRPIIALEYRLQMMAALEMVDYVSWFDELDPIAWLELIRPDVHVNGAEYGSDCIEAGVVSRYGGRVHIVSLIPGLSTSNIIRKIKEI